MYPFCVGKDSPRVQPLVLSLNELSRWLWEKPPIRCWSTLPSSYCLFSHTSPISSFFCPPPSHPKKKSVCYWLQFYSHLFPPVSFPLCLNSLPFMLLFLMLLLFLAHPTHRHQTGNCALFHKFSHCVHLQSRWTQNTAGYSTDGERKNQHSGSSNNEGLSALHLRRQEQSWFHPNSRRGVKAFGLKALNN